MSDFGIQYSGLSGQIQIGRVNRAGTEFTRKQYATNPSVFAVAEYIYHQMDGGMFIGFDGKRYSIDVTLEQS